jgi:hypothetical protein
MVQPVTAVAVTAAAGGDRRLYVVCAGGAARCLRLFLDLSLGGALFSFCRKERLRLRQ